MPFALYRAFGPKGALAGAALFVLYMLVLSSVSAAIKSIYTAVLYRYATTGNTSGTYRPADLSGTWQPGT